MNEVTQPGSPTTSTLSGTGGFLHPERVISHFDIRPGMVVADFGAGAGYFTLPIARKIGENGKIYAIDVQKQAIDHIKSRANLEHLMNIEPIWADLELERGSRLHDNAVDLVIVANILFQAEKKREVLAEAWRVLRSGGKLVVLEWDETPFPAGPPAVLRIGKRQTIGLAEAAGFRLEKEFEAGNHHYGLLFLKR